MKVRVLLNNLKVEVRDDFKKAEEYFKRHGVTLDFQFEESNIKGYKSEVQNFGSVGFRNQLTGHEDKITLSHDWLTVFVFNGNEFPLSKLPASKCQALEKGILVTLMTYKEGDVVGETYLTLIHELMHALNQYLRVKYLISIEDPMDIYFKGGTWLRYHNNNLPDNPDSNFGEAWRRLNIYIPLLESKTLDKPLVILTRHSDDGTQTLGDLQVGVSFSRATLERPWKDNKPNISCIPRGTYECVWSFSPRFMRYTYEVKNVPKRSGIRFHKGNYWFQIEGCILLGTGFKDINNDGKKDVIESTQAMKDFETLMDKKPFMLQIK